MGCHSISGGMSKLPICGGDKAVLFILKSTSDFFKDDNDEMGYSNIGRTNHLISSNGPKIHFTPRFLPIFGKYDSYIGLEDIIRDKNVEYIENYFGCNIEDIIETLRVENSDFAPASSLELNRELQSLSGMFELESIYKEMAVYGKNRSVSYDKQILNFETLERLGFVHDISKNTGDDFYHNFYQHPNFNKLVVFSDGFSSSLKNIEKDEKIKNILYVKDIDIEFKKLGFELNTSVFKKNSITEIKMLNFMEEFMDIIENERKIYNKEKHKYDVANATSKLKFLPIKYNIFQDFSDAHLQYSIFKIMEISSICELKHFENSMWMNNSLYMPTFCGTQDGDIEASKSLYEACLSIINNN